MLKSAILSNKDVASEELLEAILKEETENLPPYLSADEINDLVLKRTRARLLQISSGLLLKLGPSIKTLVQARADAVADDDYAVVQVTRSDPREKALLYGRMLERTFDAPCVSFACDNRRLLGELREREVFILTLFATVVCKRAKGDDLLMLFLSGVSSCGKSRLFESPVLRTAHNLCTSANGDAGVGRFNAEGKNTILLHDVNLRSLVGADCEKIKALCRGETVVAKVHSSTAVVDPVFVLATSNQRLFDHIFRPEGKLPFRLGCDLQLTKRDSPENVKAIRMRFLEMHVRGRPRQDEEDLRRSDNFTRRDFILGTYPLVLNILERHGPEQFHSNYFYEYVISGLAKHASLYGEIFATAQHLHRLTDLSEKYGCPVSVGVLPLLLSNVKVEKPRTPEPSFQPC